MVEPLEGQMFLFRVGTHAPRRDDVADEPPEEAPEAPGVLGRDGPLPVGTGTVLPPPQRTVHRPRPPCGYIQGLTERGMTKALGGNRGGICATVVTSGVIKLNDVIQINT